MKKLFNIFSSSAKELDLYAQNVELKIQGDPENKLLIGAFITVITSLLSIILTFPTFLDYTNRTNPGISTSIQYSTPNLTIDYTNFFFGISFFYPLKDVREIKSSSNDYSAIKFINQLNISCTTCEGEYLGRESIMNLCNPSQFKNYTLKSMSKGKSDGINSIFSEYSFCFPSDLKSVIKDNNEENSTQDTSLQLFIPVNDVSIEFTSVKKNNKPQPASSDLENKLQISNQKTNIEKPKPKPEEPKKPEVPQPDQPKTTQTQPTNNVNTAGTNSNPTPTPPLPQPTKGKISISTLPDRKCPICPTISKENTTVTCN